ncbi:AI-2E family transporter YdiK [Mesorhizobium sp. BAC0120]|uniref:AI-2E family transporter YdiK n=1 Tax=Mesorhizobium sp. BAC0120 TaxID=3090670 RepID=UPI00298CEE34|nr:AI-2E family transporter YdiK [Mesorhizobium sp. BAC0120]MDW6021018.1 AI-2E family transporter YdiK [Mesorhizobium sp. BAC0120]
MPTGSSLFIPDSLAEARRAPSATAALARRQDIGRITLTVLFIGGLLVASVWIMLPFLPAVLWATTLVLATWPLLLRVQRNAGNRRWVAVLVMTLAVLLVLIVPLWAAVSTVVTHIDDIGDMARKVLSLKVPPAPGWLAGLPVIGATAAEAWGNLSSAGIEQLSPRLTPYVGTLTQWIASAAGSLGEMFLQFLLTAAIAAVMYAKGEQAAAAMLLFGRRLAGERGETAILLAGQAIRSVALGVVVTALAQSLIGGIGLRLVGLPFAALLTALMFVLCLIQLGPGLVLVPAVIWMYYSGNTIGGAVLLLFTIVAATIDQVIRPILIRKGAHLPLLLILAGVIGGLIAFGVLGIFIGPTVLAVAYTLLNAWMEEAREPAMQVAGADVREKGGAAAD